MKMFRLFAVAISLLASPALAQWQTPNHSVPIGRGAGVTGFGNAVPGTAGLPFVSNGPGADPSFRFIPGPYVTPADFSFACDGVTDFHTQLQAMITASVGKAILIPAGPDCLTSASLVTPSRTTITGAGREVSVIRCTAACGGSPVFTGTNVSNISFSNFWCKGTRGVTSWATSSFGCWRFQQDSSATVTGFNYNFQNLKSSDFNSTYWMYIDTVGSTHPLLNVTFANNYVLSTAADIPTDGVVTNNNNYGFVMFSGAGGSGRIENTVIKDNRYDATGLCFPQTFFSSHYKAQVIGNIILSPGQTTSGHCTNGFGTANNAYGILVYDVNADGNPPTNITVANNTIINPLSAGIYFAGDGAPAHSASVFNSTQSLIAGNVIESQNATDNDQLPRAAISVNTLTDIEIAYNFIYNNYGGVAATGQMTGIVNIHGNTCFDPVAAVQTPYCVWMSAGLNGAPNTDKRIIKNNYLEAIDTTANGGQCVRFNSGAGSRFNDIEVSDNTCNSGFTGMGFTNQLATGSVIFKNNKFGGVANNAMLNVAGLTGRVALINNVFDATNGANGNGLITSGSLVDMAGTKFMNRTSGVVPMYSGVGACGTIIGTQFNNVVQPAQVAATSLGTANPSGCTLNYLDQVQNLTPSELGAAASKYVVDHWSHISTATSTTHLEQRQLTGN